MYSEFFNDANRVIIEDIEVLFLDNLFKSIKYLTFQLVYSKFVDKLYAQGIFSISDKLNEDAWPLMPAISFSRGKNR